MFVEWYSEDTRGTSISTYLTTRVSCLPADIIRYITTFVGPGTMKRVHIDPGTLDQLEYLVHNVLTLQNLCPLPRCIADIPTTCYNYEMRRDKQTETMYSKHLLYIPESKTFIERNGHIHKTRPKIPTISWNGVLVKGDRTRWKTVSGIHLIICPLSKVDYWMSKYPLHVRYIDYTHTIRPRTGFTYIVPWMHVKKLQTAGPLIVLMDTIPMHTGGLEIPIGQCENRYMYMEQYAYYPPTSWWVIVLQPTYTLQTAFIGLMILQLLPPTSRIREQDILYYLETLAFQKAYVSVQ